MTKENTDQEARIKVEDLPEAEKELSTEESKSVKGGIIAILIGAKEPERQPTLGQNFTNTTFDDEAIKQKVKP